MAITIIASANPMYNEALKIDKELSMKNFPSSSMDTQGDMFSTSVEKDAAKLDSLFPMDKPKSAECKA